MFCSDSSAHTKEHPKSTFLFFTEDLLSTRKEAKVFLVTSSLETTTGRVSSVSRDTWEKFPLSELQDLEISNEIEYYPYHFGGAQDCLLPSQISYGRVRHQHFIYLHFFHFEWLP